MLGASKNSQKVQVGYKQLAVRNVRSLSTGAVEDPRSAPFHLSQPGTHPGDTMPVEGLRMVRSANSDENSHSRANANAGGGFVHRPVMLAEIVELFAAVPAGVVIDATLGGAGHASALLASRDDLCVLGIDQDDIAIDAARQALAQFGDRARVRKARFDELTDVVAEAFPGVPVVGVLFDLGVSSPQLDVAERGFSYRSDGPLDMRMDQEARLSADTVVNEYDVYRLTDVLRDGGEEKFAARVAKAIVAARPITSTLQLAEVARNAIPGAARRRPGDPAKRSFQAIRLEVNAELEVLGDALDAALATVIDGGRIVTLAYHSGEDRIVKGRFVDASTGGCTCPPSLPCGCGAVPMVRLVTRSSKKPSATELSENSRASSARLRAVEVLPGQDQMRLIGGVE